MAICIFVQGLKDAYTTAAEIYKKDPQTLSKVIRMVEIFNAAQQVTTMLTPYMVSRMSNDDGYFVDRQAILAATDPMCSVIAAMNLATLHKTAPTRFLSQEHHSTKIGLILGHDTLTPEGTDQNLLTIDTDMGDISTNLNHTANSTVTGAAAVTEDTHCTPHPAIAVAHATLWLTDALITSHAKTHPTGIVAPHLDHITSPTCITHATTPWTIVSLSLATLPALHKDHNWQRRSSHTEGL